MNRRKKYATAPVELTTMFTFSTRSHAPRGNALPSRSAALLLATDSSATPLARRRASRNGVPTRSVGTRLVFFVCLIAVFWPVCSARAQRDATVPDPNPELERKSFQVADGFEVNLFAADPLLAKPIQMNFDARGRLWVACSETYPQIKPGQKANDKIVILEDTKSIGQADKVTVFADGLLIPTGIEPGNGG